ncbi:hypothetical protein CWE06_12140 [Aliidiomarina haloalkalitolerans]|uniref:DUF2798 domain-containing protein n=2 Tax=Aliidiomarina haloalkalitolerans TaxID=859059 RepID=A0A432VPL2_9GAMM|nr:hypothetical protein CWE06_12140 [Aliidiomarina haloalkalitolerans]
MSLYMAFFMTFVITWINTGLGEGFLGRWWTAFYIAWPIAACLMLVGVQRIRVFSEKLGQKL